MVLSSVERAIGMMSCERVVNLKSAAPVQRVAGTNNAFRRTSVGEQKSWHTSSAFGK